MLDTTTNHEYADCIELLASVELYDVIRDQRIIVAADQRIGELLEGDPSVAWWYLPGASEELCKGLLEVNDFHMQEVAAWRLGRFGSVNSPEPLQKLANTVVPRGYVNQHVDAAKRAVEQMICRDLCLDSIGGSALRREHWHVRLRRPPRSRTP